MNTKDKRVNKRTPDRVDEHIAYRIRMRRKQLGVPQTALAEKLGVAFQQVQKYEKGTNRVGAGRLYEIAQALDVPVQYFFDGLADNNASQIGASDGPSRPILPAKEIEKAVAAYGSIPDKALRESFLALMKSLPPWIKKTSPARASLR